MKIFAIDPGSQFSAYTIWDGEQILDSAKVDNETMYWRLYEACKQTNGLVFACEKIESYGMPVGREIFDTVFFTGRLYDVCFNAGTDLMFVPRKDVKLYLCQNLRAKDSNVAAAIRERFGEKPTKKRPNPIYNGFKPAADEWQSWALAITMYDNYHTKAIKSIVG